MNSNITRILSIILALSLIICCFSACGGKEDDEEPTYDIEMPTNPSNGSEDVYVNDGSNNSGNDLGLNNSGSSNSGSSNSGSNNFVSGNNSYVPNYNGNSGSSNSGSSNSGSSNSGSSNSGSGNSGSISGIGSVTNSNQLKAEIEHFMTHIDTPEERNEMLALAGYEYDPVQDVYYTSLNPWQRSMGFTDIYDTAAPLTNMYYLTLKADFVYKNLLWRLQWWKGQYGILEGAELGVYTKSPYDNSGFYKCAEDDQLLTMTMDFYHSWADYQSGNRLFTRLEQEHWWLTGFKFGIVSAPKNCVVRATLYAYDDEMADGIEAALQNLTDAKNNLTGEGFVPYKTGVTKDYYIRKGNRFDVVWKEVGYLNFNTVENPEQSNPNVEVPTTPAE